MTITPCYFVQGFGARHAVPASLPKTRREAWIAKLRAQRRERRARLEARAYRFGDSVFSALLDLI